MPGFVAPHHVYTRVLQRSSEPDMTDFGRIAGAPPARLPGRTWSIVAMIVAEIAVMSLWFVSAAILPEMMAEGGFSEAHGAALSSAVQIGFVAGALGVAISGIADRLDPRAVFLASAMIGALANLGLLVTPLGGWEQVGLRALTGACMAGTYPVGMKICVARRLPIKRRGSPDELSTRTSVAASRGRCALLVAALSAGDFLLEDDMTGANAPKAVGLAHPTPATGDRLCSRIRACAGPIAGRQASL